MSFLNTTHNTLTLTNLPPHIEKEQVLALLHDHDKMITMNPLVTAHHQEPSSFAESFFKSEAPENRPSGSETIPIYSITDDMSSDGESQGGSWRGGWAKRFIPDTVTYNASMQNRTDGLLSITHAPMGVHSITTWLVKEAEDGNGGLLLEERGKVTSNRMLMSFIKTTLQESHEKLVRDFVAALEREIGQ